MNSSVTWLIPLSMVAGAAVYIATRDEDWWLLGEKDEDPLFTSHRNSVFSSHMGHDLRWNPLRNVRRTPMTKLRRLSDLTGCDIYLKHEEQNALGHRGARLYENLMSLKADQWKGQQLTLPMIVDTVDTPQNEKLLVQYLRKTIRHAHDKILISHASHPDNVEKEARAIRLTFPDRFFGSYDAPLRRGVHFSQTGPEILRRLEGHVPSAIVAPVETGGMLAGLSEYFREAAGGQYSAWHWSHPVVFAALPAGSSDLLKQALPDTTKLPFQLQPLLESPRPSLSNSNSSESGSKLIKPCSPQSQQLAHCWINGVVEVDDQQIVSMARWLLKNESLHVGPETAQNVLVAVRVARALKAARQNLVDYHPQEGAVRAANPDRWFGLFGQSQSVYLPSAMELDQAASLAAEKTEEAEGTEGAEEEEEEEGKMKSSNITQLLADFQGKSRLYWELFSKGIAPDQDNVAQRPVVVTFAGDAAWRFEDTLWNEDWLREAGLDPALPVSLDEAL